MTELHSLDFFIVAVCEKRRGVHVFDLHSESDAPTHLIIDTDSPATLRMNASQAGDVLRVQLATKARTTIRFYELGSNFCQGETVVSLSPRRKTSDTAAESKRPNVASLFQTLTVHGALGGFELLQHEEVSFHWSSGSAQARFTAFPLHVIVATEAASGLLMSVDHPNERRETVGLMDVKAKDQTQLVPFGVRARKLVVNFGDGFAVYEAAVGLTHRFLRKLPALLPHRSIWRFVYDNDYLVFSSDEKLYVLDFTISQQ